MGACKKQKPSSASMCLLGSRWAAPLSGVLAGWAATHAVDLSPVRSPSQVLSQAIKAAGLPNATTLRMEVSTLMLPVTEQSAGEHCTCARAGLHAGKQLGAVAEQRGFATTCTKAACGIMHVRPTCAAHMCGLAQGLPRSGALGCPAPAPMPPPPLALQAFRSTA